MLVLIFHLIYVYKVGLTILPCFGYTHIGKVGLTIQVYSRVMEIRYHNDEKSCMVNKLRIFLTDYPEGG